MIKLIQRHTIEELRVYQGLDPNLKESFTIHFWLRLYMLLCCALSGMLCSITVTGGKILMTLLAKKDLLELIVDPPGYIFAAITSFTVINNFVNLNSVIRLYSQLQAMPLYESCIIFMNLLCGGFIMNEFEYYSAFQMTMVLLGSAITVSGILYKVYSSRNEAVLDEKEKIKQDEYNKMTEEDNQIISKKKKKFQIYREKIGEFEEKHLKNKKAAAQRIMDDLYSRIRTK